MRGGNFEVSKNNHTYKVVIDDFTAGKQCCLITDTLVRYSYSRMLEDVLITRLKIPDSSMYVWLYDNSMYVWLYDNSASERS